ncbi:MAG: hypothetical protein HQK50_16870 [Oligoflexia bacterium]|nr:hypothetical protein [Oligoflexia bacterium]MBF0367252.1 hypothetical protein [Oligoflexia bacterium]
MFTMSTSIVNAIKNRIFEHGRGWVFTAHSFADLDSYTGVRTALSRLQKERVIRRVAQGIYDYPKTHKTQGILPPSVEEIAKAYAAKNGAQIQAAGAYAASLIGISMQTPDKVIFLTDGPIGKIKIKRFEICFRKSSTKNIYAAGTKETLSVQVLKFIKQKHLTAEVLTVIREFLRKGLNKKDFEKNLQYAPYWIKVTLFELMKDKLERY